MKLRTTKVTDQMVERGARAAFRAWSESLGGARASAWDELSQDAREQLQDEMRAGLTAALEPS